MLVDVQFGKGDPQMALILGIIGNGKVNPERLGEGMYLAGHWSIDRLTNAAIRERWKEDKPEYLDFDEYGVCDTPEQAIEYLKLKDRPEKFFISFVKIERDSQPPDGGWRWHKWGPYIGAKEPQCEYIHDEPYIESVYTYHVYELDDR